MFAKLQSLLANLAASAVAVLITLLLLEFVVFRYVLVPDDVLPNTTINDVVRYAPHTQARFRHPDGSSTLVRINAQGWNSNHTGYLRERTEGVARVAVIGDSYVHNKFVETDETFTALLEKKLTAGGRPTEVFRFGMDGAPLSQYLHVLRKEVLAYRPDVLIIPLIHNDFDEIYRGVKSRYASSFLKVAQNDDGSFAEIAPSAFKPGLADRLRQFATFRYLYYETNFYLYAKRWINRLYWGGSDDWDPRFISSAVDIRKVNDHVRNRLFARYVLKEIKTLTDAQGIDLIIAMDGVRDAIYDGRVPMDYEIGRLNRIARQLTSELGITFIDFHETFAKDYAANRQRFEFSYDWHWNVRANNLIADALMPLVEGAMDRRAYAEVVASAGSPSPQPATTSPIPSTGAPASAGAGVTTSPKQKVSDRRASTALPPLPSRNPESSKARLERKQPKPRDRERALTGAGDAGQKRRTKPTST